MKNFTFDVDPVYLKKISRLFTFLKRYFRYEVRGLENIPDKKALVVMNHGVLPYHGFLLAKELFDKRHMIVRGLGADFLFQIPGLREFFVKGGVVNASPRNAEKLLKEKNVVMLAPGGIYEALIAKEGLGRIPWERRKGFVRIAIKTKTPIIPTYCRGINGVYFNSYLFLKPRIRLLEMTRFSIPFFFGLGLLPLPRKLIHVIGKPIFPKKKRGESHNQQIDRIHNEIILMMACMAKGEKV